MLKFTEITKAILLDGQQRKILDIRLNESLEIRQGDFVFITGDSGSGKTTLLSILGLLDNEYEGNLEATFEGETVHLGKATPTERQNFNQTLRDNCSYIFQDIRVQFDRDALDNVTVPLRYKGVPKEIREPIASEMLVSLDIAKEDHKRRISAFSGGMQQRVGIARALANRPKLLLVDEPTAHLDKNISKEIYKRLHEQATNQHITTLVVSHDTELVLPYADIIIHLETYDTESNEQVVRIEDRRRKTEDHVSSENTDEVGSVLFREMWVEAMQEFKPTVEFIRYCLGGFLRGHKLPPSHLYLSNVASIVTCVFLFATTFLIHVVLGSANQIADTAIGSQIAFRQVSLVASEINAAAKQLDLEKLKNYMTDRSIQVQSIQEVYELGGRVMNLEDRVQLQNDGTYGLELESKLYEDLISGVHFHFDLEEPRECTEVHDYRKYISMEFVQSTEPMAHEYYYCEKSQKQCNQSKILADYSPKVDNTPKILLSNDMSEFTLWTNMINGASFQRFPTRGDGVQIVIASEEQVSLTGDDDQAEQTKLSIMQNRIHTCIQFELDGFFQRKSDDYQQIVSPINDKNPQSLIAKETMLTIKRWRNNPLDTTLIPESWLCKGHVDTPESYSYTSGRDSTLIQPIPYRYDVLLETPLDAKMFDEIASGDYARELNTPIKPESQRETIEVVLQFKKIVRYIGTLISLIPVVLSGVIILLVIQSMMLRKRRDLLLYLILGASKRSLMIQSMLIASCVLLPSLLLGLGLVEVLQWAFVEQLQDVNMSTASLSMLTESITTYQLPYRTILALLIFAMVMAYVVCLWIVTALVKSNPSQFFRGGE